MTLDTLRDWQDNLAFWLLIWTAIVALGLVVEYTHDVWLFTRSFCGWLFRRSPFDRKMLNKTVIGGLLITVGVLGEAYIEERMPTVEGRIRKATDDSMERLRNDTARAQTAAKQADLERVKLASQVAWRALSPKQQTMICSAVSPERANRVTVIASSQDAEEWRYAQDLWKALDNCARLVGLKMESGVGNRFWGQNPVFGLWIIGDWPDPNSFPLSQRAAAAKRLRDTLAGAGVKIDGGIANSAPEPRGFTSPDGAFVDIYVGPRHPPQIDETPTR